MSSVPPSQGSRMSHHSWGTELSRNPPAPKKLRMLCFRHHVNGLGLAAAFFRSRAMAFSSPLGPMRVFFESPHGQPPPPFGLVGPMRSRLPTPSR
eukprot:scaffold57706_cov82-Phaeocystis_antarctica.AAC.8